MDLTKMSSCVNIRPRKRNFWLGLPSIKRSFERGM